MTQGSEVHGNVVLGLVRVYIIFSHKSNVNARLHSSLNNHSENRVEGPFVSGNHSYAVVK